MALDPNRWTLKTQEAFNGGVEAARSRNNPEVTPEHVLLAMLGQEDTVTLPVLGKVGLAPLSVRNRLEDAIAKLPRSYGSEAQMSRDLRDVLDRADSERSGLGDEYLSIEHLLLAMADQLRVSQEDLLEALKDVRGSHRVTSQNPEEQYRALEKYGRDLTEEARKGKLDPARTGGGSRRYSERDIDRLRRIQDLTTAGLNLEGVRRVMELEDEVDRLHRELDEAKEEALEAIRATHRQYRRDLVPVKNSPIPWRRAR